MNTNELAEEKCKRCGKPLSAFEIYEQCGCPLTPPTGKQILEGIVEQRLKTASTQTLLTRGAIKKYALAVSVAKRAGKFTRVGESFIIGVEAELEAKLRALGTEIGGQVPVGSIRFINGTTKRKAAERLELAVAQIIHGKVMRHPSIGVTLKD